LNQTCQIDKFDRLTGSDGKDRPPKSSATHLPRTRKAFTALAEHGKPRDIVAATTAFGNQVRKFRSWTTSQVPAAKFIPGKSVTLHCPDVDFYSNLSTSAGDRQGTGSGVREELGNQPVKLTSSTA